MPIGRKLTEYKARKAKPRAAEYRLTDGAGLFLLVKPNGGKLWRYNFTLAGSRRVFALGIYPTISLEDARQAHLEARRKVRAGIDPLTIRQAEKAERVARRAIILEPVAREWYEQQQSPDLGRVRKMILARLEYSVFPVLGNVPLEDITPDIVDRNITRPLADRGAVKLASRLEALLSAIVAFGAPRLRA